MNDALSELQAQVAAIDARDDRILALVSELKTQVEALQAQIASQPNVDAALADAAAKLSESVAKFDSVLPPAPQPEPVVEPTPAEPVVEPATEPIPEEPVADPTPVEPVVEPAPEPTPAPEPQA